MREEPLVFGRPVIEEAEIAEVVETLRSGWIGTGPRVARFEEMFAESAGTEHAVALSSCTAALHLTMVAAGIGAGDEVITTPMTFCATANAIVHAGARPVFADVEADAGTIDPAAIEAAIGPGTAAIIAVHFGGRPCRMDEISAIAERHGLLLIEDAAHAVGATHGGRPAGSIGDAGCFSFYATKAVCTAEGGMVTTDDAELAAKVRTLALHGLSRNAWERFSLDASSHYEVVTPGFKANMTDIQAALGIHQLARVGTVRERLEQIWGRYDDELARLEVTTPLSAEPDTVHARHLYSILIDGDRAGISRDELATALLERRIGTGIHYTPIHLQPYYREALGHQPGEFPEAERIGEQTLSLPLSAGLDDSDVDDVTSALAACLAEVA